MENESSSPIDNEQENKSTPEFSENIKPPSRIGNFFRRFLRWLVGAVILFALGVGVTYFVLYLPAKQELAQAQIKLEQIPKLESSLEATTNDLQSCKEQRDEAIKKIENTNLQTNLLTVLADINRANFSLLKDDLPRVRVILMGTTSKMKELSAEITKQNDKLAKEINQLLIDAIRDLDSDPDKAQATLDRLSNTLLELQNNSSE
jgi:chromosome segregation ATPase